MSRGGSLLVPLAWLKYCLTQSNSRGWVSPGPVARWKSTMRLLKNTAHKSVVPSQSTGAHPCSLLALCAQRSIRQSSVNIYILFKISHFFDEGEGTEIF